MTHSVRTYHWFWFRGGRGLEAAAHYCALISGSRVERSFAANAGIS